MVKCSDVYTIFEINNILRKRIYKIDKKKTKKGLPEAYFIFNKA